MTKCRQIVDDDRVGLRQGGVEIALQRRRDRPVTRTRHSAMHSRQPASTAGHNKNQRNIKARSEVMACQGVSGRVWIEPTQTSCQRHDKPPALSHA